jgi:hypothetical protein
MVNWFTENYVRDVLLLMRGYLGQIPVSATGTDGLPDKESAGSRDVGARGRQTEVPATPGEGPCEKGGRVGTANDDAQIVIAVYSHLSRLYVSSYATFFTSIAALMVFNWVVLLAPTTSDWLKAIVQTPLGLLIWAITFAFYLGFPFVFFLRTKMFSKTIRYIQGTCLVFSDGLDVGHWLEKKVYPKGTIVDDFVHLLFENSERIATLAFILFLLVSLGVVWLRLC